MHSHLINNDIVDNFQSAYKTGHSCETALLRVYNDIVTTIGAMLVLLDLYAAFDTIVHDNFFSYLFYLIYMLLLTPLFIIICFAYWKNMSEFLVMH